MRVFVLLSVLLLAGCSGRPSGNLVPIGDVSTPGASRVDMLVATTRADGPVGEMFNGERAPLSFADLAVSIPPDAIRQIGDIQWPKQVPGDPDKEFVTLRADHLTIDQVKARFADRISAHGGRVIVFVHGYNTKFEEAVYRLAQIIHDSGSPHLPVLYTWPSRAKLLSYGYDRESANYSRDGLEAVLWALQRNPKVKEIAILAHSMGNWVTLEALRQMAIRSGAVAPKIQSVMLAAPDVDIDVFRRQIIAIGDKRPPFALFTSQNDVALSFSSRVWQSSARLGAINPNIEPFKSELARDRIFAVDLTGVKSDDPLNHGTFAQSPDIVRMIGTRLAGGQALSDGKAGLGDRVGLAVSGAVGTVGEAASLAVSAPLSIVDANSRENLADHLQSFNEKATDTLTLKEFQN